MENEIWKDAPGYDGYYQVSNYGHVKSLSRQIVVRGNTRLLHNDRFIKISKYNNGYCFVTLSKNGKNEQILLHRLVMKTFVGNSKLEVNHKDGNKENNNINNLEYVTHSENQFHSFRVLKRNPVKPWLGKRGEKHNKSIGVIAYNTIKTNHIKTFYSMNQKTIILENGHGSQTPGKRSPIWGDGSQLFEWEFNRDIVRRIAAMLKADGVKFEILVPEETDVSLPERCRRANVIHADCGNNAVLFSVHGNAGGGTGWECYTSVGQTKADAIATVLCEEAEKEFAPDGWKMRFDYIDGDPDKESQFYILKHTVCPAVLSENFFFDNEKDCRFMMSDAGRERIAKVHYNTIKRIL